MKDLRYVPDCPDETGWRERYLYAVRHPTHEVEMPLLTMIQGWIDYARSHEARFNSRIGDDRVLGDEWFAIGAAMLGLLNGDLGRLDGGTLDTIIRDNLEEQGFDADMGKRKES